MRSSSYLIFHLHSLSYGVAAEQVKEIFLLPKLTTIVDAPPDIIGLLDLHGQIIPVMHLDLRFGQGFKGCNLSDSVIVLEFQGLEIAVIVHQVNTVINIEERFIQQDLDYGREQEIERVFIRGIATIDNKQIILLDVDKLLRHQKELTLLVDGESSDLTTKTNNSFFDLYCPDATSQDQIIFLQRADSLRVSTTNDAKQDSIAIAVFGLGGEYFGLDLKLVREFIKISKITHIPCCPQHIIGNMNLRGEILTLVELHQILNINDYQLRNQSQAVVFEFDEIVAGIVVDEVCDAINLPPENLKPLPVALAKNSNCLKATATYLGQTLHLIDLPKILNQGLLTVDMAA